MCGVPYSDVILHGYLKVKRGGTFANNPGFGGGLRWGTRYFILTKDRLVQTKSVSDEDSKVELDMGLVSGIREASNHEEKAGFGSLFTNSVKSMLTAVTNVITSENSQGESEGTRFILEVGTDAQDGRSCFIFEAESSKEVQRWLAALKKLATAGNRGTIMDPFILVKENAEIDIHQVYDLGSSLGSGMYVCLFFFFLLVSI